MTNGENFILRTNNTSFFKTAIPILIIGSNVNRVFYVLLRTINFIILIETISTVIM